MSRWGTVAPDSECRTRRPATRLLPADSDKKFTGFEIEYNCALRGVECTPGHPEANTYVPRCHLRWHANPTFGRHALGELLSLSPCCFSVFLTESALPDILRQTHLPDTYARVSAQTVAKPHGEGRGEKTHQRGVPPASAEVLRWCGTKEPARVQSCRGRRVGAVAAAVL